MTTRLFATFYLEDTLWGINVLQVREVLRQAVSSPVPHTGPHIRGLMNLRGQIVTLIEASTRLGHEARHEDEMCIVLKSSGELVPQDWPDQDLDATGPDSVGLIVGRMGRVLEVDADDVRPAPANVDDTVLPFVKGVVRLDGELLLILSLDKVLEC